MRGTTGDAIPDTARPGAARFQVLGPVAATDATGRSLALGPPRSRALLAALIVHAGRVLTVDQLTDLLWDGSPPATAPTMVHGAVAALRAVVEPRHGAEPPGLLVTRDGGYELAVRPEQTDVGRFRPLLDQARPRLAADPAQASALLAEALALWRGPALDGIEAAFAREAADRWEELRLEGRELRIAAELALGHHHEVVGELQQLVLRHPFREHLAEHLVVAQYRCGRQADSLQTLRLLRRMLAAELGVEPGPRIQQLERAVLHHSTDLDAPLPRQMTPQSGALPAPYNSFVGRRRELGDITVLCAAHRLVTMTGPGGSGKSRLAVEVARRLMDDGADDIRLIDLARLTAPALVGETVAQACGIRAAQGRGTAAAIGAALSGRDATIVLDNCEHLVEVAAEFVESLLAAAPRVKVLVTSREALRIPGEWVYAVGPLETADPGDRWEDIAGCASVQLFAERASAARPGFTLTRANAPLVLEVCRRLDGLPLALELAAARAASLPLAALAERLDDRFRLLDPDDGSTGVRHRSLAATLRWSYELLSEQEQLLFARLTVFPATFTLAAAEAVAAGTDLPRQDVGRRLGRLVAVSTIQMADDEDGETRYRLLETTREFGREQLAARTASGLRERHAHHFLAVAQAAAPHLLGPASPDWLSRLRSENDNFRAALDWAFGGEGAPHLGAQLIAVLWHPWDLRGARDEGLHWVRAGLGAIGSDQPELRLPLLSAGALFSLGRADFDTVSALTHELLCVARTTGASGWAADALRMDATVAWARGRFDRAQHLYEDAVTTASTGNDLWRAALAEAHLARLHRDRDEPDAARTTALLAVAHAEEVGEALARGLAVDVLASVEHRWGDRALAQRLADEAHTHYRLVGYSEGESSALFLTGRIALDARDWEGARMAFAESLALCRRIGHPGGSAASLEGLAHVAAAAADDESTGLLLGAASALRDEIGSTLPGGELAEHHQEMRRLTERLGSERVAELLRRGSGVPLDEFDPDLRRRDGA